MEFTCKHNQDNNWEMQASHFHNQLEVLLSLTDGGSFFVMNHLHPLRRGTLLLMQDQVLHRSTSMNSAYERYVLHIPPETLSKASSRQTDFTTLLHQNRCVQLDETNLSEMERLMDLCLAVPSEFGDDILRDCALLTLLVMLVRLTEDAEDHQVSTVGFSPPVRETLDWIRGHLTEELSLEMLAERCYVTKYHLCRIFKEETSFTIGEYVIQLRLQRAAALLRTGESVQKAGELSGFQSNSHFIRTFGRLMGTSPGRYQRRHMLDDPKI